MEYTYQRMRGMETVYGEAFYILDIPQFIGNYRELLSAFQLVYKNTIIAYSYKTNYIPKLCKAIDDLGGYAEIVSDMEYDLARRVGVSPEKIVFNGPYKKPETVRELLLSGGTLHLDSLQELDLLQTIAEENPARQLNIGIRISFPIDDGVISRFGFDAQGEEFKTATRFIERYKNIHLRALHCHFASRALKTWRARAQGMLKLVMENNLRPECIDLGGGMYGKMDDQLKQQFDDEIPTYKDYAQTVGEVLHQYLNGYYQPMLMIEPGSALVGDCMDLVAKVQSVKTVQGQKIATVLASTHNIQMGDKSPTVEVISPNVYEKQSSESIHIAGFTCIEKDYLAKDFRGSLSTGDYAVFRNVGSYSIVLKPPFILPNFPVLALDDHQNIEVVKRAETTADVFQTYV